MIGKGAAYLKAVLGTRMIVSRSILSGYGCSSLTSAVVFTGVLVKRRVVLLFIAAPNLQGQESVRQ